MPGINHEFRDGWRPLLACAVGIGLGLSPLPAFTSGIFAIALHREFGWSRASVLGASLVLTAVLLLLGPAYGRACDRVGARRVAIASTIGLGISLGLLSFTSQSIWSFYAGWLLVGVVSLGTLPITYSRIINGWFNRSRGTALGMALCTTGITGMFAPVVLQGIVDRAGWRAAYLAMGATELIIALPVLVLLLKEAPSPSVADRQTGAAVWRNFASRRFWIMAASGLSAGLAIGGVLPNIVPLFVDRGFPIGVAARYAGLLGLSVVVGRLGAGWLLDRIWAPFVVTLVLCPPFLAFVVLAGPAGTPVTMMLCVIAFGLSAGAEFDTVAYMTSRYFPAEMFGTLYSVQYAIFAVGSGSAPAMFGYVRDQTGSYRLALLISAVLVFVSSSLLYALGRYPALAPATRPANS